MSRFGSSITPLLASASWDTGILLPGLGDRATGVVFSDQGGNIFIEQSIDSINWDVSTTYAISASTGKGFSEEILLPYLRVRYVNGSTNQGIFRISVRISSQGS